jgi:peptidoglycan/LPS O-acetylase OafA/YrhL
MNKENLLIATTVGLILQLLMVVAGHYLPPVKAKFAVGGMLISLIAGALYIRLEQQGWQGALVGGAIAGGVCALLAIAVSVSLKDVPAMILMVGTLGSVVAGLVGGAIAKLV